MAIFGDLARAHKTGQVSEEELQQLLVRSATANAISNATKEGASSEELAGGVVALSSVRLTRIQNEIG